MLQLLGNRRAVFHVGGEGGVSKQWWIQDFKKGVPETLFHAYFLHFKENP